MDKIEIGELITLDDDKEYCVIEIIEEDNHRYLYMVNEKEEEVVVGEEVIEEGEIFIETLDDQDKIMKIVNIALERLKEKI